MFYIIFFNINANKKTIAKEKLYKRILTGIREIHPNFNIGVSTGLHDWNTWAIPYRHLEVRTK